MLQISSIPFSLWVSLFHCEDSSLLGPEGCCHISLHQSQHVHHHQYNARSRAYSLEPLVNVAHSCVQFVWDIGIV